MAYKFERTGSETKITPTHTESGLPKVECCVNQVEADRAARKASTEESSEVA